MQLLSDDEATVKRNYAHAAPDLLLGVMTIIYQQADMARLEMPRAKQSRVVEVRGG